MASRAFTNASVAKPLARYRRLVCQASVDRRAVLLSGAAGLTTAVLTAPEAAHAEREIKFLQPNMLSTFQKADQRNELYSRSNEILGEVLTKEDARVALRLVFNDAATYDVQTRTGGMNGSIVLSAEEANRPENAALKPFVKRLAAAKERIDAKGAEIGQGPISWADLMTLAARVAVQKEWTAIKIARAANKSGGETIGKSFGAQWDVRLGRVDSSEADSGRVPASDAPVEEIRDFLLKLGTKPGDDGPFAPKPLFWQKWQFVIYPATTDDPAATEARFIAADPAFAEFKQKYDISRKTVTRTDYEVDLINQFTKLTDLGAKFDPMAYLYPVRTNVLR